MDLGARGKEGEDSNLKRSSCFCRDVFQKYALATSWWTRGRHDKGRQVWGGCWASGSVGQLEQRCWARSTQGLNAGSGILWPVVSVCFGTIDPVNWLDLIDWIKRKGSSQQKAFLHPNKPTVAKCWFSQSSLDGRGVFCNCFKPLCWRLNGCIGHAVISCVW